MSRTPSWAIIPAPPLSEGRGLSHYFASRVGIKSDCAIEPVNVVPTTPSDAFVMMRSFSCMYSFSRLQGKAGFARGSVANSFLLG